MKLERYSFRKLLRTFATAPNVSPLSVRADNLVLVKFGFSALSVPRFFSV